MNYKETLDYLYASLPMFHRIGAAAYKADLSTTIQLSELTGHPEKKFPGIHIAGTNGKGSVSSMLAAVLQSASYKTGLFTSPHLKDFRERIRINGEMIPEYNVVRFVEQYRNDFERLKPSFFEWTAALAFRYFAEEKVEVAVIETGMGGRLDSTNIVKPVLTVITNISKDHQQFLGDTLEKIAFEKAGIIKPGIPVVIGETQEECFQVFREQANRNEASLVFADQLIEAKAKDQAGSYDVYRQGRLFLADLVLDLPGIYQGKNLQTVIQSVLRLREAGFHITEDTIRNALSSVRRLTGLRGRWEVLGRDPLIICDVGHNEAGIKYILEQISKTPHNRLHWVFGAMKDKDLVSILPLLPGDAGYYFCSPDLPRALPAEELKNQAAEYGLKGDAYASVTGALESARTKAGQEDLIFIGGSTFVVAEVL